MKISEVSEKYGLTQDALRYYERIGLIPPVTRNHNGIREYDDYSCGWIEFIHCMRKAGIQVEVLVDYVQLYQQGPETKAARKKLLMEENHRLDTRITEFQALKKRLSWKIENYDQFDEAVVNMDRNKSQLKRTF